jgi:hypothetical protein
MATVCLNTHRIVDWQSFHEVCRETFGFPEWYGMNLDAWIDCMSSLDEEGMTRFNLAEGERLDVEIMGTEDFQERLPDVFTEFIGCTAVVNQRYAEIKSGIVLAMIFR